MDVSRLQADKRTQHNLLAACSSRATTESLSWRAFRPTTTNRSPLRPIYYASASFPNFLFLCPSVCLSLPLCLSLSPSCSSVRLSRVVARRSLPGCRPTGSRSIVQCFLFDGNLGSTLFDPTRLDPTHTRSLTFAWRGAGSPDCQLASSENGKPAFCRRRRRQR